jgi:streptogramin lyase
MGCSDSLIGESVASSQPWPYARRVPRLRTAIVVAGLPALISCVLAASGGSAPGASTVVAKVKLGGEPCGVVGTPGGIWVADYGGNRLVHIDTATATVVGQVRGIRSVCELTYARGALWAPSRTGVLYRVDPTRGTVTARIPVNGQLVDVVAAAGSVWVVSYSGRAVIRVNPRTNRVVRRIPLPRAGGGGSGITAAGGAVWAGQTQGTAIYRIDPRRDRAVPVTTGSLGPAWFSASGDDVWFSNIYDDSVQRLDAATRKVTATVAVRAVPVNLEVVGPDVWVPNDTSDTVTRIDRESATVQEVIPTAENPAVVAGWRGDAWVTMYDAGEVWQIRPPAS